MQERSFRIEQCLMQAKWRRACKVVTARSRRKRVRMLAGKAPRIFPREYSLHTSPYDPATACPATQPVCELMALCHVQLPWAMGQRSRSVRLICRLQG